MKKNKNLCWLLISANPRDSDSESIEALTAVSERLCNSILLVFTRLKDLGKTYNLFMVWENC